jgi:hypothetical protein
MSLRPGHLGYLCGETLSHKGGRGKGEKVREGKRFIGNAIYLWKASISLMLEMTFFWFLKFLKVPNLYNFSK